MALEHNRMYQPESLTGTDTQSTSDVDLLEARLLENARMDHEILARTLGTRIEFPDVYGTVGEILTDKEKLTTAIDDAVKAFDRMYEVVLRIDPQSREQAMNTKTAEVNAHMGILSRAQEGRYNGRSMIIGEFSQYFVGSFLSGGYDAAQRTLQVESAPSQLPQEAVVFNGR